jgi:hypothetical protein
VPSDIALYRFRGIRRGLVVMSVFSLIAALLTFVVARTPVPAGNPR